MAADHLSESSVHTVVLVHGWGSTSARTWTDDGIAGDLRRSGADVIAESLPGHVPDSSTQPEDYSDIDRQLHEQLSLPTSQHTVDAVGFSLGGKLLLRLASSGALPVRRLVMLGVGGNMFTAEAGNVVSKALVDGPPPGASPSFRQVIAEAQASGIDPAALGAVIRRPPVLTEPRDLEAVASQVLIIVGEDDDIAVAPDALAAALPFATLVRLPRLSHSETPHDGRVRRLVSEFLLQEE